MADRATFLVSFPEFSDAPTALVDSRLAQATARTDADVWGAERVDDGIYWLTAHLLAISPLARDMKNCCLPNGETTYLAERQRMARAVASGFRLADPDFVLPPADC